MPLQVVIMKEKDGQWTNEVHDSFEVPGDVVEVRLSGKCEMQFTRKDGSVIHSTDLE
jgi:hypothetical protein